MTSGELPISQWPNELTDFPADWNDFRAPAGDDVAGNVTRQATFANWQRISSGQVATIADLRALNAASIPAGTMLFIRGHTLPGIGAGAFRLVKDGSIGANRDDNGVIIHAAGGPVVTDPAAWYWRRSIAGELIIPDWWGGIPDANFTDPTQGTDSAVALQAFFDFGTSGYLDNGLQADVNNPIHLHIPNGFYRLDSPLFIRIGAGAGSINLTGDGVNSCGLVAGASMDTLLTVSQTSAGTGVYPRIRHLQFSGGDHASNLIVSEHTSKGILQDCRLAFAKGDGALVKIDDHSWVVKNNEFTGRTIAQTLADQIGTSIGLEVTSVHADANNYRIRENSFLYCKVGVQFSTNIVGATVQHNLFEEISDTGIFLKEGAEMVVIDDNYFEDVGWHKNQGTYVDGGVQVEVSSGVEETWYGAIVGTPRYDALGTPLKKVVVTNNMFGQVSPRALASFRYVRGLTWRDNRLWHLDAQKACIALHREGVPAGQSAYCEIQQQVEYKQSSIQSADTTANTITIGLPWRVSPDVPHIVEGSSLPAPLTDGQVVFMRQTLDSTTTFELAASPGGAAIDFTTSGTGTIKQLSQFGRMLDLSGVSSQRDGTSGVIIREHRGSLREWIAIDTAESFGGNPISWPVIAGSSVMTKDTATLNGAPIWKIVGSGVREYSIAVSDTSRYLLGRSFRVSGLATGASGAAAGVTVSFGVDTGSGFVDQVSQTISTESWADVTSALKHFVCFVPYEAQNIRFRISGASGTNDNFLAGFSIASAAVDTLQVPHIRE